MNRALGFEVVGWEFVRTLINRSMNYQKIYDQIIDRARERELNGYRERHHILPRCMGGDDSPENLVELTAREHFLCHWLLTKIHPTGKNHFKAVHAFSLMVWGAAGPGQSRFRARSHVYANFRTVYSRAMSRSQTGERNSQYGTRWAHNEHLQLSKRFSNDSELPEGWNWGRVINWEEYLRNKNKRCKSCGKKFRPERSAVYCSKACQPPRPSGIAKKCIVDGVKYDSVQAAANDLGVKHVTMWARLRSPHNLSCQFVDGT